MMHAQARTEVLPRYGPDVLDGGVFCRENSPELRELENKLRQAYINKELYVQLCERRKQERLREEQVSKPLHYNSSGI